MIPLILLVLAFVLFLLAAFPVPEPYRARFIPAGLASATLAVLIAFGPGLLR